MSSPVSGAITWNTPVTINSGDVVASSDLNHLNQDVAALHARPWWNGWHTATPGTGSTGTNITLFNGSNWTSVTSTSGVQTISPSSGVFTPTIPGMYRISAGISAAPVSAAHFAIQVVAQGASSAIIFPGSLCSTDSTSGVINTSTISLCLPMGTGAPNMAGVSFTSFYIRVATYHGSPVFYGTGLAGYIPTYAMVEGPVASFGAY
jgi:hypothetical protein